MSTQPSPSRRRGRPPKGQGPVVELRGDVPVNIKAAAEKQAASMGLHLCDYLAYLVSTDTGEQIPGQEALPLGKSA